MVSRMSTYGGKFDRIADHVLMALINVSKLNNMYKTYYMYGYYLANWSMMKRSILIGSRAV